MTRPATGRAPGRRLVGVVLAAAALLGACVRVTPQIVVPDLVLGEPSFYPTLEAYAQAPIVGGNRIDVLLNGDEIFPAALEAIRSARRTITYAQYIFEAGAIGEQMADAFAERCRAGVTAYILLDGFGSLQMPPSLRQRMQEAGCQVVAFRPIRPYTLLTANNRNHRRILVVDGRVGFTGGSGVTPQWTGDGQTAGHWRDTDIRLEGPVVEDLQGAFAENWLEATGIVLGGAEFFPRHREAGRAFAQVVRSSPEGGASGLYTTLLLAVSSARQSIHLTTPYFLPDRGLMDALVRAAGRNVKVVILVPGLIDHQIVREAGKRHFGRLLRAGVEIYEYMPALLHSKTLVIDGVWATIGSSNLDNRSFALNQELNVIVYDRDFAGRLERVFADDLGRSRRLTYQAWRHRGFKTRFLELFVLPFRDLL